MKINVTKNFTIKKGKLPFYTTIQITSPSIYLEGRGKRIMKEKEKTRFKFKILTLDLVLIKKKYITENYIYNICIN